MAQAPVVAGTGLSNTVSTFTTEPSGQGRRATSCTAASLQDEPSIAKSIFMTKPPSPHVCAQPVPPKMGEFLGRNMDEVARFFAGDLKFPQLFVRVALLKSRAWGLDTVSTVSNLQL